MQAEEYCKTGQVFELDIVANYGWIRSGLWAQVEADMKAVCDVCHSYQTAVSVIFETDALTIEQVKKSDASRRFRRCGLCKNLHRIFTGGKNEGATVEVISAMMEAAQAAARLKAPAASAPRSTSFS